MVELPFRFPMITEPFEDKAAPASRASWHSLTFNPVTNQVHVLDSEGSVFFFDGDSCQHTSTFYSHTPEEKGCILATPSTDVRQAKLVTIPSQSRTRSGTLSSFVRLICLDANGFRFPLCSLLFALF